MPRCNRPSTPFPDLSPPRAGPASPGASSRTNPRAPASWAGKTRRKSWRATRRARRRPLKVLEVLIELFNTLHTALEKTVSHKTRHERAHFLRRFFRDLQHKAGFKTMPDPRNLGQKHIHAMVQVWQQAAAGAGHDPDLPELPARPGDVDGQARLRAQPGHYGLSLDEYQRHESAQRDKSWSAQGIDAEALIAEVCPSIPVSAHRCG